MDAATMESNLDIEIATLESAIVDTAKLQSIIEMELKTIGTSQKTLETMECDKDSEPNSSWATSDPPASHLGSYLEPRGQRACGDAMLGEALGTLCIALLVVPLALLSGILCFLVALLVQVPGSIYVLGSLSFQHTITYAMQISHRETNIDTNPRFFYCTFWLVNWMIVKIPLIVTVAVLHLVQFVALLPATYVLLVFKTLNESTFWDEQKLSWQARQKIGR